jgi:hypothetical protein
MPGQVIAESPAEKAGRKAKPKKEIENEPDEEEDEKRWRATLLKADLLNIEIAERKLAIIAPRATKTKRRAKRS